MLPKRIVKSLSYAGILFGGSIALWNGLVVHVYACRGAIKSNRLSKNLKQSTWNWMILSLVEYADTFKMPKDLLTRVDIIFVQSVLCPVSAGD